MDREYSDISAGVRRSLRTADRFDNYRQIAAKFASTGTCGHAIKKGETIGYSRLHGTRCAACWSQWAGENAAAAQDEELYRNVDGHNSGW